MSTANPEHYHAPQKTIAVLVTAMHFAAVVAVAVWLAPMRTS